ncbi:TonB family protein [Mucilaginibacter frigoritolerans]|uniref:TonB family protein n=1 Tax=Mucilaginibacter frigoritolerans TaxID=652788 RepID=A0A562TMM7_9SPHI|nr:M56 family metallopeptidase [Mucilaginibacter frigoritolerans]TWI94772.1 TonB family protein [Mucilaginibacter frigoritolerans]
MNWLYYLAEANAYLAVFYLAYCLLLKRNTHYQLSRAYLIFSCIAAFILPVLQLGALRPVKSAKSEGAINYQLSSINYTIAPEVKIVKYPASVINTPDPVIESHFTLQHGLWYAYLIGATILLFIFLIKLYTLFRLTRNWESVVEGKYRVIYLTETDVAFSFFNYVFVSLNVPLSNTIIRHELVHVRQKHSADIIFLELLKVINWFNPFVYLLQNSLKTVHEYIADEHTAAYETDTLTYSSFLLNNAYGSRGSSITHSFFNYNQLKKRIIMLNQQRSGNLARLKYLVAIPICIVLLGTSTLVFSKTYGLVDLAPAIVKSTGRYPMVNTNYTEKRKHLKITQNGIITIADKFSVDQKNQKIVYTAGTITKNDRTLLLKKHHIKVEVVEDSTRFTTKDGQLILPIVNIDGYYLLDHFLHNNIHYTSTKGEKGGLVEVGFSLDKERHITNAKITKSGGTKLDALALNGFNSYKGVVNDAPGKDYKIGVYFFTDNYSIFKTDSLGKDPEFAGELIITNYKYPVSRTSKGYEYDESGIGFPGDDNNMAQAKVVIYDKNGEATWYYRNKCTTADLKLLKDKYGYTFPSAASSIIQFMHPKNVDNSRLAYIFNVTSYLEAPYVNQFYNYMLNNTTYPAEAKKALTGGLVVLNFNLDVNGTISDVNVAQSAGNSFDEAAVNALQSCKLSIKDNTGKHSIAILFCVAENKYRPVVSESIRKEGYVGELAICDVKSPFVNGTAKYTPPVSTPGSVKN